MAGSPTPRIPGHEVAGVIDAVGPGVASWQTGQRAGVGWFGGAYHQCDACRAGDFILCRFLLVAGVSYDGGYAEYMVAPTDALAKIPDDLSAVDAAPLLCAGITTFNALRHSGARPGDLVAILVSAGSALLVLWRRSIQGWLSGTSLDSEDTLAFSALQGVRPMIETAPLERAPEAYDRMMSGKARYRMVLSMQ